MAGVVVPLMAGIPAALQVIVQDAFTSKATAGGAVGVVIQKGISRGVFSNEAGLGTAPIAQASARPVDHVLQGSVATLGTVIDTLIICTMTALVIVISSKYLCCGQGVILTKSACDWAFRVLATS
ncbi:alanine:cation symporter family protein [Synechococcus sp. A10-1-5-9]|uniref:alanine:cation symporter family protein n=1 Tax=Synechococcus sp. A10-1-5-9 TaxID=3392295 RepID=UPI0039ED38CE